MKFYHANLVWVYILKSSSYEIQTIFGYGTFDLADYTAAARSLVVPSYYWNQYWLIIGEDLWHSPESNSQEILKISFFDTSSKITNVKSQMYLPGIVELKTLIKVWIFCGAARDWALIIWVTLMENAIRSLLAGEIVQEIIDIKGVFLPDIETEQWNSLRGYHTRDINSLV